MDIFDKMGLTEEQKIKLRNLANTMVSCGYSMREAHDAISKALIIKQGKLEIGRSCCPGSNLKVR